MSIELPGWVADAFNQIGLPWPGTDEDQLRAWAGGLRAYAAEITALSGSSRSAVAALAASNDSSFARTLAVQWEHHLRHRIGAAEMSSRCSAEPLWREAAEVRSG